MNKSIFHLTESPNDLPSSNENMAELFYREVLTTREVGDRASDTSYRSNFGGTPINFRVDLDNRTWWIPSRSYFKIEVELTKPGNGDVPLTVNDQIALNMGSPACLFNSIHYKINDTTVCQITERIPQCEAMAKRIYHSPEWLNNTNGMSTEFWNPYQKVRLQEAISDGLKSDYVIRCDKDILELEADDRYTVLTRANFNLGVKTGATGIPSTTTSLEFTVANVTWTFKINEDSGFDIKAQIGNLLQKGDIVFWKYSPNVEGIYAFVVVDQVASDATDTTIVYLIAPIVSAPLADFAVNSSTNWDWTVYRHKENIPIHDKADLAFIGNSEILNTGLHVFAGSVSLDYGDIVGYPRVAASPVLSEAGLYIEATTNTNLIKTFAYGLGGAEALAATDLNKYHVIKMGKYYTLTRSTKLGYEDTGTDDSGHAIHVEKEANKNWVITFTRHLAIGQPDEQIFPLPNLKKVWKTGDILVFRAFIDDEGDTSDTRFLYMFIVDVQSDRLIAADTTDVVAVEADFNVANDCRSTVYCRLRYKPSRESLECNSVNCARLKNKFDMCWKPSCLSIFNYPGALPGGSKIEFVMQALARNYTGLSVETPYGVKKRARIENDLRSEKPDFQLLIKNMKFYMCTVQGPAVGGNQYSYYINMNEIRVHKRSINTRGLHQYSLDVMPSSYALCLAFQDKRAENRLDTDISATKFHVYGDEEKEEESITRYSIRFAGISLPQPDAEMKESTEEDFITNQYIRNQMYTNLYFKTGGGESLCEWKERGIYFYHPFIRSAGNKETRAYVVTQFNSAANTEGPKRKTLSDTGLDNLAAYLFEFYRSFALVKMKNGYVYSVLTANQ